MAKTLSNNTTSPGSPGAGFTIGALSDGTRAFAGEVDEVAVYTSDISGVASAHWAAGRKTDAVTALTTRNAYDRLGRVTDAWTPALVRTKAVYDRLGNQTETIANYLDGATTGGTAADDVKSTFAYDVLGELIGYCPAEEVKVGGCDPATPSEVQAWHYEFDLLGRQTKTIPPDNTAVTDLTTEEVVYETGGRIAKTCRYPAGQSCGAFDSRHVDFTYDDLGRVVTQGTWDRDASPAADTLKFTKAMTWLADGSPATVNEGSDALTNVYDDAGRISQLKRGSTVLTAYTYTAGTSTIATRTDGTQGATAFTYDWARRQTIIDPPDAFVAGTVTRTYRLDGLLATQSFPSSLTETLAYDAAKRPLSISLGSAGSISQTFDRAGNITSDARSLTGISGNAGTGTQSFTYDGLSRLTGSSLGSDSRSYQYDLDGNRTRRVENSVTTDFTYDRADQLATQTIGVTVRTYDYDRYGNLLASAEPDNDITTYAYDEASRLKTISPPGGAATQITFTLDALDRHATRAVNGSTTDTYAYLDATETAWQTGQGTTTTSLLDADGSRLAVKTGSTVSWLVFDLHGSVVALCPSTGSTLSDAYRFDGWGQQIASAGSATNPWRYRGLLNVGSDALTGALLDMAARHYSPQLGTFTQQDSVQGAAANPATMNRFLYAHANPATLIDPDGHRACLEEGPTCVVVDLVTKEPIRPPTGSGGGAGGTVKPTIQSCDRACERGASTPDQPTLLNPWALESDFEWNALKYDLLNTCYDLEGGTGPTCEFAKGLAEGERKNKELFCRVHADLCAQIATERDTQGALLLGLTLETIAFGFALFTPVPEEAAIGAAEVATWEARIRSSARLAQLYANAMQRAAATASTHGNSLASNKLVTLYQRVDAQGNFLKWGITDALKGRYSQAELAGGRLIEMFQGTRPQMQALERFLTERTGGPLNLERWAGRFNDEMDTVTALLRQAMN